MPDWKLQEILKKYSLCKEVNPDSNTSNAIILTKKAANHLYWVLPRVIKALKEEGYEFRKIEFPKVRRLFYSPAIQRLRRFRNNLRQFSRWA